MDKAIDRLVDRRLSFQDIADYIDYLADLGVENEAVYMMLQFFEETNEIQQFEGWVARNRPTEEELDVVDQDFENYEASRYNAWLASWERPIPYREG